MLLSDPNVRAFLHQRVVPVWESVGSVPQVTIDFGDGRVLKRTLGGNTVLYLCLPDGRVVDALPGVYTPADFLREVEKTLAFFDTLGSGPAAARPEAVREWHKAQVGAAIQAERMRITMSKAFVESPLLSALGAARSRPVDPRPMVQVAAVAAAPTTVQPEAITDYRAAFTAVSAKIEDISKQPASAQRIRARYGPSAKPLTPEQLGRLVVEEDSRTNIQLVRPAVHLFFAQEADMVEPAACRDAIYKQILHVPIGDPYLGLADALVPGSAAAGTPGG